MAQVAKLPPLRTTNHQALPTKSLTAIKGSPSYSRNSQAPPRRIESPRSRFEIPVIPPWKSPPWKSPPWKALIPKKSYVNSVCCPVLT